MLFNVTTETRVISKFCFWFCERGFYFGSLFWNALQSEHMKQFLSRATTVLFQSQGQKVETFDRA